VQGLTVVLDTCRLTPTYLLSRLRSKLPPPRPLPRPPPPPPTISKGFCVEPGKGNAASLPESNETRNRNMGAIILCVASRLTPQLERQERRCHHDVVAGTEYGTLLLYLLQTKQPVGKLKFLHTFSCALKVLQPTSLGGLQIFMQYFVSLLCIC